MFFLLVLCLCNCSSNTTASNKPSYDNICVDEYDSLIAYYPNFSDIELAFGSEVPSGDDILYCCGAAFTAECLKSFTHENIRCNHVTGGTFYYGSEEPVCNGVFTYYNGKGHFAPVNEGALHTAADSAGMGFCQVLAVYNGEPVYTDTLKKDFWIHRDYVFRALCEKDGRLCIIESKEKVPYGTFVRYLIEFGVEHAINLDMGGWSHAWYHDNNGEIVTTNSKPTRYATNWLIFKK